ncbi:putative chromatin regulator PHD family [Helianthus annuus]|uniref:Phorbol-ester/DAG-type domain-containing protein n=1 Tax=Helianthus annuus TaxID=4232 RepID=A0A251S1E8_HELAN|nr:putative chromatin regulator PHD family [Helianthus annuus]KAJ0461272.1 putative chromatin regulator PHD family [Helianthus annuus]KAJ0645585.1 putative chromatin regulator PHD family [Helianthus annuus]
MHPQTHSGTNMDQGFKHFSHLHNLIMHQMPQGIQVSCSACHSSATGIVYVCWQCNFFLHDQCYRANRSLKHPSHPTHPLASVPYPTYHSNSYSCANSEFDLHVHCTDSTSRATSFKNAHLFQELVPQGWYGEHNSSRDHHIPFASVPESLPVPFAGAHNQPNTTPSSHDPSMPQDPPSVTIPTGSQNPNSSAQYPSTTQNRPVSIPTSSYNSSAQYTSLEQAGPSVSIPTDYAQNPIPSGQDSSMPQSRTSVSIPTSSHNSSAQYPSVAQSGPSIPIPTDYPQNPISSAQDPSTPQNRPSVSVPTSSQNSSAQYPSVEQTGPTVSIPTNPSDSITRSHDPSKPQNGLQDEDVMHFSHPHKLFRVNLQEDEDEEDEEDEEEEEDKDEEEEEDKDEEEEDKDEEEEEDKDEEDKDEEDKDEDEEDEEEDEEDEEEEDDEEDEEEEEEEGEEEDEEEEDEEEGEEEDEEGEEEEEEEEEKEVICSGCKETLVGKGYSCIEKDCDFHLHESCFHLDKEINHKSHPEHPLTLLPQAPYDNKDGEFTCNACSSDGSGFTYHCSICTFDLHTTCVSLPETVKRDDHKHTLKLFYSCPVKDEDFYCDVCHGEVQKDCWVYYCEPCNYGSHLDCVDSEEYDCTLDPQAQLQMLQLQMQMARQSAQFMASCGASLASLA